MSHKTVVIGDATLHLGDCLEILPTLDKVDAVITDPPYVGLRGGLDRSALGGVAGRATGDSISVGDEWGANFGWCAAAWDRCRYGVMVFGPHKSIVEARQAFPDGKIVALLTWYKRNSPPTGKNLPRWTSEFVWALSKAPGIHWDRLTGTVFDIPGLAAGCMATERFMDDSGSSVHPTQKPEALMRELMQLVDGSVLDPFMGTGTTGVAAIERGLPFVGIEREPRYFDLACKRIEQAHAQRSLFVEAAPQRKPEQLGLEGP
jgi:site-specific DNA-methyltransferase (adenine-specific)/modification methylase